MTNTTNISSIQPVQQPELESATYQEDPGHVSSLVSPRPVVLGEEQEVLPHDSLNKTECRLGTKTVNLKLLHNPCEEIKKTREERRTSDRQMLNLLKTENDAPLKKRSFEGTFSPFSNSFSVLDNDTIIHKANEMGVPLDSDSFHSIDLIKELEIAIFNLNKKASENLVPSCSEEPNHVIPDIIVVPLVSDSSTCLLDWENN